MALVHEDSKETIIKIVYLGAESSGKTQSLISLSLDETCSQKKGGYFEFLPIKIQKYPNLRLHLFTLPSHDQLPHLNSAILANADGFIFTVDPRPKSLHKLSRELKRIEGISQILNLPKTPRLFQVGFFDEEDAIPLEQFQKALAPDLVLGGHLGNQNFVSECLEKMLLQTELINSLSQASLN